MWVAAQTVAMIAGAAGLADDSQGWAEWVKSPWVQLSCTTVLLFMGLIALAPESLLKKVGLLDRTRADLLSDLETVRAERDKASNELASARASEPTPAEECAALVEEGQRLCVIGGRCNPTLMDDYRRSVEHFGRTRVKRHRRAQFVATTEGGPRHKPGVWCGTVSSSVADFLRHAQPADWLRSPRSGERTTEAAERRLSQALGHLQHDTAALAAKNRDVRSEDVADLIGRIGGVLRAGLTTPDAARELESNVATVRRNGEGDAGAVKQVQESLRFWRPNLEKVKSQIDVGFVWDDERATAGLDQ